MNAELLRSAVEREQRESVATRTSLLTRLKDWNDQESWNLFFDVYWKLLYSTAIHAGLSDSEAQEVVQDTVISVSKAMPGFTYNRENGSFKAWLRKLTYWRIKDKLRKRGRQSHNEELPDQYPDPVPHELEQRWNREWEVAVLQAAVERVKRQVDAKQFQLFDAFVIQQWPMDKIRSVLNTGRARVYVAKHRVAAAIRKEFRYLQTRCY